jgi:hypothetical protein
MRMTKALAAGWMAATAALSGCVPETEVSQEEFSPSYMGIGTVLLDDEMVNFRVAMSGARSTADVEAYARCAAAQYALIRGFGFARHVRTTVNRGTEIWRGDAVYVISAALPEGLRTLDAEVVVRDCGAQGIPTV